MGLTVKCERERAASTSRARIPLPVSRKLGLGVLRRLELGDSRGQGLGVSREQGLGVSTGFGLIENSAGLIANFTHKATLRVADERRKIEDVREPRQEVVASRRVRSLRFGVRFRVI